MSRINGFGGGYSELVRRAAQKRQQSNIAKQGSTANESRFELVSRTKDPLGSRGLKADPNLGAEAGRSLDQVIRRSRTSAQR